LKNLILSAGIFQKYAETLYLWRALYFWRPLYNN
jgi:hypothetical protein